ncbi:MAG TPA: hypothetical protein PLF41_14025 [Anaerolineales bacterium]|nr:hypothetical protein [Anaerolineales bacterium]
MRLLRSSHPFGMATLLEWGGRLKLGKKRVAESIDNLQNVPL